MQAWGTRLLAMGLAVGLGGVAHAQTPASGTAPAEQDAPLTLHLSTRLTVVDVTVVDSRGQPVRGLAKDLFTIEEDGKPQPIRSFQEYTANSVPLSRALPKLPPHIYTNLQPTPTTSAVNVLLLDSLNTAVQDQVYVKQETVRFLKNMPKGTRIAIFGLSTQLRILQGFTQDPELLLAAINSKKNRAMPSPFSDSDVGDTIDSMNEISDAGTATSLQQFETDSTSFQADRRNRMTLEALDQIAAYLSGVKGRKNLIWFTGGIPLQLFPSGGTNDLASMTDYTKDVRRTTDLLTNAQVAVYPVDARGLMSSPANSAVNGGTGFSGGGGNSVGLANAKFLDKTATEQLLMVAVAEATGGVAYYNTNGLKEAVGKAVENGANYYSVSYRPPNLAYDGAYHRINVVLKQKGMHLSFRKGYYADDVANNALTPSLTLATSAPQPYGNNMQASMGRGVPPSTQILFDVRVEPETETLNAPGEAVLGSLDAKLAGKPTRRYGFLYVFPGRQITFTEGPNGTRKGALEFDIAAYDVYGKLITSLSQTINLPLKQIEYQRLATKPFQFFQKLDLPPGEMFIRVGVLDKVSEKVGTMEIPVTVSRKSAVAGAAGGTTGN